MCDLDTQEDKEKLVEAWANSDPKLLSARVVRAEQESARLRVALKAIANYEVYASDAPTFAAEAVDG